MRCSKAQISISAALDGELDQASRARLSRHLEECADCVRYQEDLERCRLLIRESEAAPSAQFEWKVQLGIARALRERASGSSLEPQGRFWLPAGVTAVITASLVLAVGLWWLGSPTGSPEVGFERNLADAQSELTNRSAREAPLRTVEQQSSFRPQIVNSMPELGRSVRPDWRTPPSMQGQISTVNGLRMAPSEPANPHLHFGYRSHSLPLAADDSVGVDPSSVDGR